ncbi:MAG: ASCH domain-containing protein [Alphaproteobacteria bacterium]|nr:ASCH domain-containing protein [Alphaproteobacteria bacterium]
MKVILSIKPEFVEKIFSGEKRFEYRKSIFKQRDIDTIIIYSTMPVGMIVGEFKFKTIHADSPKMIWKETKKYSGITKDFFYDYFKNKETAFAIEIEKVHKYKKPLNPYTIFTNFTAPQSFCYLEN